jgi:predicted O-methyltransferase YrrM
MEYKFTSDWFSRNEFSWKSIINNIKPRRYLEIGSYEGRSAAFMIENCTHHKDFYIYCIDTWEGGVEHSNTNMSDIELNFNNNISVALTKSPSSVHLNKMKKYSDLALLELYSKDVEKFDFIYIDGSHQAADVLKDAVLSFGLLKVGGVMVFDDYLWFMEDMESRDLVNSPKLAIDSFINCNIRKLKILSAPLYQVYIQKIKE